MNSVIVKLVPPTNVRIDFGFFYPTPKTKAVRALQANQAKAEVNRALLAWSYEGQ